MFSLAIITQTSAACSRKSLYCPQVEVENNFDIMAVSIYFLITRIKIFIKYYYFKYIGLWYLYIFIIKY